MPPTEPQFANEAAVEWHVIEPLLARLGYAKDDVSPKHPIVFREGRRGRRPEADYAVFSGKPHGRETSLFVIEAKRPGEPNWSAKDQAESYQHALRAPFLMLVDGLEIEVWQYQASGESELVFGPALLADLESHFDLLSLILSKEASIAHCNNLRGRSARASADDWSPYISAELDRLDRYGFLVDRTLLDPAERTKRSSLDLIAAFPRGASVTAASGYGKTSLAVSLMRQALEDCASAASSRLPILVPCNDLPASIDLISFAFQRLKAHKLGLTQDSVLRRLKDYGLTVVIDSFEHLAPERRSELAKELRNLSRDYPRLQVFLLSRRGALLSLDQPTLHLEPLSDKEQREIVATVLEPDRGHQWVYAPILLHKLCRIPLLLDLTLAFWRTQHSWPTGLAEMFSQWLTSIVSIGVEQSQSRQASRRQALRKLALRRAKGPISVDEGMASLSIVGLDPTLLDELIGIDAVETHASGLAFPHDALGDYLLALEWVAQPEAQLVTLIKEMNVERGSIFPVLLLCVTTSVVAQRAMWQRLMQGDIQSYFDALRYRADGSATLLSQGEELFAQHFLEEILDGIEQPLKAYFPELVTTVVENLAEDDAHELAVIGYAYPDSVDYCLVPRESDQPRVTLGSISIEHATTLRYIDLRLSGMRSDAGRLIGTKLLRDTLNEVVRMRKLRAGKALASERLYGRLQYLAQEYGLQLKDGATVKDALAEFGPRAGQYVCWPRRHDHDKVFPINEILSDLQILQENGMSLPSAWWRPDGRSDLVDFGSDSAVIFAVDEEFRRAQKIYKEIVQLNFASIAEKLPIYGSMPVRYQIAIKRHRRNPDDRERVSVLRTAIPVDDWSLIGADLVSPPLSDWPDFRTHQDKFAATLERLGRYPARVFAPWSAGVIERFDGTDWLGNFDGETAAIRTAFKWLDDDLKIVFEELPDG